MVLHGLRARQLGVETGPTRPHQTAWKSKTEGVSEAIWVRQSRRVPRARTAFLNASCEPMMVTPPMVRDDELKDLAERSRARVAVVTARVSRVRERLRAYESF